MRLTRQLGTFAAIGITCSVINFLIFFILDHHINRQLSNLIALVLSTIINTAANRHYTFGVKSKKGFTKSQLQGFILLGISWITTSTALWIQHKYDSEASTFHATIALACGTFVATIIRFICLKKWFTPGTHNELIEALPTELNPE